MLTRFILMVLLSLLAIQPAKAFDFALIEIIGFSEDGNTFAFEQYGVQDGSGFPYSDIFIIDTRSDNWINNSPFRTLLHDENATLQQARKANRDSARDALTGIDQPGIIAASNRVDELTQNPYSLTIAPKSFFLPDNATRLTFQIENLDLPQSQKCLDYQLGSDFKGFRLTRTSLNSAQSNKVMHEDASIPDSRNCPLDYQPESIVIHISETGKFTAVVLVRMETLGFEGSDRRYLAVTGGLN